MAWLRARHGVGAPLRGIDFNDNRDGVWSEGTARFALALRRTGAKEEALRICHGLLTHRDTNGWLRATDGAWITTGLTVGPG